MSHHPSRRFIIPAALALSVMVAGDAAAQGNLLDQGRDLPDGARHREPRQAA